MRVGKVLRHGIALNHVEAQALVPGDELCRNGRRAAARQQRLVQAQVLQNLALHNAAQNRNAEQAVELLGRHLGEYTLLELEPQAGNRDERGGPCTVQIRHKGVQAFGKEYMRLAVHHGHGLHPGPLKHVRQRQVGQDAVVIDITNARFDVFGNILGNLGDAFKAVHHALGRASGARCVQQDGDILAIARDAPGQGLGTSGDGIPLLVAVFGSQRERNAGQGCGHAGFLCGPGIELADKQQTGTAVLQNVADGLCRLGWEDRHGCAARHPDRQLRHEEVRAILGQQCNACTGLQTLRLDVRSHAARLVQRLAPGVINHLPATNGLGQVNPVSQLGLMVINIVQNQFGFGHRGSP